MSAVLPMPIETAVAAVDAPERAPLTASERLALSRERLRQAMHEASAPRREATSQRAGGTSVPWLDHLKSIPGASVVIEAVSSWWAQHPLRIATMVGADAAKTVVQPIAQRHPLALVVSALLLGGLFAWSRPWRWILKPALFAGLLPQLFSKAIAYVPVQSWMAALTSLAQEPRRPSPTPERQPDRQAEPTRHESLSPGHPPAS